MEAQPVKSASAFKYLKRKVLGSTPRAVTTMIQFEEEIVETSELYDPEDF